jgi:hypothetical protein
MLTKPATAPKSELAFPVGSYIFYLSKIHFNITDFKVGYTINLFASDFVIFIWWPQLKIITSNSTQRSKIFVNIEYFGKQTRR